MASNQGIVPLRGTGAILGTPSKVTFVITLADGTSYSGYVMGITSSFNVTHVTQNDRIISGTGGVVGTGSWGDMLEATFNLIPSGTSLAEAKASAGVPTSQSTIVITGAPVFRCGPFSDAINVTSGGILGNKWIYEGRGGQSFTANGQAGVTLPLVRFEEIVGGTAVVS